jgi:hypothetical protein
MSHRGGRRDPHEAYFADDTLRTVQLLQRSGGGK